MSEQRTCGLCGEPYPSEELYPFDGLELCPHCLNQRTLTCERCGRRIWDEDNAGSSDTPLCQSCFDDHYTHCCRCGTLLHESSTYYAENDDYDEYPYCVDCYQEWGKEAQELHPGDVVNIPTGVKHWHGAAPDSWFSHLALEVPGENSSNEWLEAVSDEEYSKFK